MLEQTVSPLAPTTLGHVPQEEASPAVEPHMPLPELLIEEETLSVPEARRGDGYSSYSSVVTARFPDRESGLRARDQLNRMDNPPAIRTLQWFEKGVTEEPWGDTLPGLAVGEAALIAQVDNSGAGEQIVQLCETAGATRARLYPLQRMFQ